jgi:uncharacterized protein
MIRAALALFEATGEAEYLQQALEWQATLDRHYADARTGGYYLTANDAEGLVLRPSSIADDAISNPNALVAQNLVRLALYSGQDAWRRQADKLFDGLLPLANENLFMHLGLLNALDFRLRAAEIVVVGLGAPAEALTAVALEQPFLDRAVLRAHSAAALPPGHPVQAKIAAVTAAAAFICVGETCSLPVTRGEQIVETLEAMRP